MNWLQFGTELAGGLLHTLVLIIVIVIPLSIIIEIVQQAGWLTKRQAGSGTGRLLRTLGMTEQAAMPLAAGLIFGLAYGAGLILQFAQEGHLTPRDRLLMTIFLVGCHAVFEDILIFVPLGVNPFALFAVRFVMALVVTWLAARVIPKRETASCDAPFSDET